MNGGDDVLTFAGFRLLPTQRTLLSGGEPVRLGSRALDVLIALTRRAGETLSNEELVALVWPDTTVEHSNVKVHVAAIRKVLGDGRGGKRFIVNLPLRGYRFVAPVVTERARVEPVSHLARRTTVRPLDIPAPIGRLIGRDEAVAAIQELTEVILRVAPGVDAHGLLAPVLARLGEGSGTAGRRESLSAAGLDDVYHRPARRTAHR